VTVTLDSILAATRARVAALHGRRAQVLEAAGRAAPAPPWAAAFGGDRVALIAEIKRRSPSAGPIAPQLDAAGHARAYVAGGAAAISVLTDGPHFGGSMADLTAVRRAVPVPVLRKDFIIDPLQLYESRGAGASAVLLIARALAPTQLQELSAVARELGLARLVEVHALAELDGALELAPEAVGVNCRDLATFVVRPETAAPVLAAIPAEVVAVAESGIATRADVERVAAWGADAILVGTALAGTTHLTRAVASFVGVPRASRAGGMTGRRGGPTP
jgi:indole-3-glycerol phosphate synthase